jgi:hypothetical protein
MSVALCSRRIDSTAHQSRRGPQVQASERQINWHQLQELPVWPPWVCY